VISKKWLSVAGAAVLALGLVACGDDEGDGGDDGTNPGSEELSGTIAVDGSSTVAPLSEAAAELFAEEQPGVEVVVGTAGTGGGFERFCAGETDISDASRPIDTEEPLEAPACEAAGIEYAELQIANDALTVMINPDNPVECLTVEQLAAIWGPDSTLANWSEVPEIGVDFNEELALFGPGTDSGTFDYFTDEINGEEGAQRTDYQNIGENDNQGITGVQGSPGGMFYAGFSFYEENQDSVKALQIDSGSGCVAPTAETVLDGTYTPLARPLFIYPKAEAAQRPEVEAFLQFYVENAQLIAEERGFVGLSPEQLTESQTELDTLLGG
jgi:phosphate transport system substrate-binding protein